MPYTQKLTSELNKAISHKSTDQIKKLLPEFDKETINKPDVTDFDKKRPIDCAVESGTSEIIKLLVDAGADLNSVNEETKEYPLHLLVRQPLSMDKEKKNCQEMLRAFDQLGADFNVKNKVGQRPLHVAIVHNNIDILSEVLLEIGKKNKIDINAEDNEQLTPLRYIFDKYGMNRPDILEAFGNLGAQGHSKSANEIAELLNHDTVKLEFGSNVNSRNAIGGDTPLHLAVEKGHVQTVATLLACHSRLDIKNDDDETPLDIAHNKNQLEVFMANETILFAIQNNLSKILESVKPETKIAICQHPKIAETLQKQQIKPKLSTSVQDIGNSIMQTLHSKHKITLEEGTSLPPAKKQKTTSNDALIKSTVRAIMGGNENLYNVFITQVRKKPNGKDLISSIIENCQKEETLPKKVEFYTQTINELKTEISTVINSTVSLH